MPELPEVETIKRGLSRLVIGKKVSLIRYDNDKSFPNSLADVNNFLLTRKIINVRRRAKLLIIDFNSGYSLITHLKMTGQLVFDSQDHHFGAGHPTSSLFSQLPDKSTRVEIYFDDDSKLFFNDQRKFGWMRLYPTALMLEIDFINKLGPEPLESDFSWQILKSRLMRRRRTSIKPALMDQTVIAGVGNIYADESLWGAKIHPASLTANLTDHNFKDLHQSLLDILKLSIKKGGSTDRNYVDAEGKKGSYLQFARVFRREGQPCPRCQSTIVKIKLAGRGTHYCPQCQKLI